MLLQCSALTSSHDHSPILRWVPARIAFPDQLNVSARFPKILFTTAVPIFALFWLLGLHRSSRKYEAVDAGVRDRHFDRWSGMRLRTQPWKRSAFRVSEEPLGGERSSVNTKDEGLTTGSRRQSARVLVAVFVKGHLGPPSSDILHVFIEVLDENLAESASQQK
jgi:hypothetical protein